MPPPGNPDLLPMFVGTCIAAAIPWGAYALLQDSWTWVGGAVASACIPYLILHAAQRYEEAREKQETHAEFIKVTSMTVAGTSGIWIIHAFLISELWPAAVGAAGLVTAALLARLTQHNDGQQR
jgi:hypothetical protein